MLQTAGAGAKKTAAFGGDEEEEGQRLAGSRAETCRKKGADEEEEGKIGKTKGFYLACMSKKAG